MEMNKFPAEETYEQFGKALDRLEEALNRAAEKDDLVIDATIKASSLPLNFVGKH